MSDNYIWLLADDNGHALVVDPGEAAPVEQALKARGLALTAILLTHHHDDHIGGVAELVQRHAPQVFAPRDERIGIDAKRVGEGDHVQLSHPAASFSVLEVPGHTRSHIAYVGEGCLFCGDTLFSLGCGRLFEGTPAQMVQSLAKLSALPDDTLVCCAHEYTQANAAFAASVEPQRPQLARYRKQIARWREAGQPSVPSTLATEKALNPFLRTEAPDVRRWAAERDADADTTARFAALRQAKDTFSA
nr:hydroxyacylglutathione hydrolase [Oleiagrimonas sp. C23AA]